MTLERFGKNMTEIREFLEITQAELAKRSKLTPAGISQIESGAREPTLKTIVKIIDALGCSFERMMK